MKRFTKLAAVMAGLLLVSAGSQAVFANCTHFGAGFPIFQCGFRGFFAPKPAGAGSVSAAWWQLGYGNKGIANGFGGGALEGTSVGPAGAFSGNDNGNFSIVLTDARSALPSQAALIPAGSTCFNFENGWAQPGVDGCADNPRTTADDDNFLNPFFSRTYGPGSYSNLYQLDYPTAVLLTESNGKFFSVAFIADRSRGTTQTEKAANTTEGDFNLGAVTNGDANPIDPGKNSVIPWQTIPKQRVDAVTFSDPGNKQTSDRQLALSWQSVRVVSDGSVRPSGAALSNAGNGVGVLDQGPVARYVVEGAPTSSANPDPGTLSFSALATFTGNNGVVTVPPDTAIRLRTVFGKAPSTTSSAAATCRLGGCGDLGYDVVSGLTIIAGPLVSERAYNIQASREKGKTLVSWDTTSELSTTGFDILGEKGNVLKHVACVNCTTGVGASYSVELTGGELKGAKQIRIRQLSSTPNDSPLVPVQ